MDEVDGGSSSSFREARARVTAASPSTKRSTRAGVSSSSRFAEAGFGLFGLGGGEVADAFRGKFGGGFRGGKGSRVAIQAAPRAPDRVLTSTSELGV